MFGTAAKIAAFAVAYVVVLILVFTTWIVYLAIFRAEDLRPQQATVFVAVAAIGGWVVTAYIARRNSTKQHTMNVLTQVRISSEMNQRLKIAYEKFPDNIKIDSAYVAATPRNDDVIRAITYILNYYEFLAVALHHSDVDHDLLKDCVRGQLCGTYEKFRLFIETVVAEDPRGAAHSKRYAYLRKLYNHWKRG